MQEVVFQDNYNFLEKSEKSRKYYKKKHSGSKYNRSENYFEIYFKYYSQLTNYVKNYHDIVQSEHDSKEYFSNRRIMIMCPHQSQDLHIDLVKEYLKVITDSVNETSYTNLQSNRNTELRDNKVIPIPPSISELVNFMMNGQIEKIYEYFLSIKDSIKDNETLAVDKVENILLLFSILKKTYDKNTLNYEIYNEIQELLLKLYNGLKEKESVDSIFKEINEVLKTYVDTSKEISYTKAANIILEDTGQKIGEKIRIFKRKN